MACERSVNPERSTDRLHASHSSCEEPVVREIRRLLLERFAAARCPNCGETVR